MLYAFLKGMPGHDGAPGPQGIPGCNGTKVRFLELNCGQYVAHTRFNNLKRDKVTLCLGQPFQYIRYQ